MNLKATKDIGTMDKHHQEEQLQTVFAANK